MLFANAFIGRKCPDCDVRKGELHVPGCDVERCPRCGGQAISCGCIYEFCKVDIDAPENRHIYEHGPTQEMYASWDEIWAAKRQPWNEEWPGAAECREFGWYSRMTDHGWQECGPDEPGAGEDLNRLVAMAEWDAEAGRWRLPR